MRQVRFLIGAISLLQQKIAHLSVSSIGIQVIFYWVQQKPIIFQCHEHFEWVFINNIASEKIIESTHLGHFLQKMRWTDLSKINTKVLIFYDFRFLVKSKITERISVMLFNETHFRVDSREISVTSGSRISRGILRILTQKC